MHTQTHTHRMIEYTSYRTTKYIPRFIVITTLYITIHIQNQTKFRWNMKISIGLELMKLIWKRKMREKIGIIMIMNKSDVSTVQVRRRN